MCTNDGGVCQNKVHTEKRGNVLGLFLGIESTYLSQFFKIIEQWGFP